MQITFDYPGEGGKRGMALSPRYNSFTYRVTSHSRLMPSVPNIWTPRIVGCASRPSKTTPCVNICTTTMTA